MAALLKEVETGTCGRRVAVAYEDVHLCNRTLWEPSLLAQNTIKNSMILFASDAAVTRSWQREPPRIWKGSFGRKN